MVVSLQGQIQEFLTRGVQTLVHKGLLIFFVQITSPPHPLLPIVVAHFNSLASYCVLEFYSYRIHPWNILLCLVTKIVHISSTSMSRSWCKCMSASPDNHSSDILFLRYDLIRRKPENEHSALAELTGRVQPIIAEPRSPTRHGPP